MSAHRRYYFPAPPAGHDEDGPAIWGEVFAVLAFIAVVAIAGFALAMLIKATATPVATPEGAAESLANARIEGFRAGYSTVIEHGCAQPIALDAPIGAR